MNDLTRIPPLRPCRVRTLKESGKAARRLKELGVLPGATICVVGTAPLGGALAFSVRGSIIAVRADTARKILVE